MFALPPIPPGLTSALPGGVATVRVEFPVGEGLYSREVPLVVHLTTPWGEAKELATGTPAPIDPAHYFGRLDPLNLNIAVPSGARPGAYHLHLSTALYLCSKRVGQCYVRRVEARATVQVGQTGRFVPIRLPASLLGSGR